MDNQYQKTNTITNLTQLDDSKLRLRYLEEEINRLSSIVRQQDRAIRRLSNEVANLKVN